MHWSHPSYRAETELPWNFGVSTSSTCKVVWNFISHLAAAVRLLKTDNVSPICRYFVEIWAILMACTWKNRVLLAAVWDKISIFFLGQIEHSLARRDGLLCAQHRALIGYLILRYLVNTRIWAESTELSRFPPPRVEFCSPRASRIFERAITQLIMRDDPWHHINQLCIRALTSAHAFAAATCCARPRACRHRSLNILKACEPMGFSSRRLLLLLASYCMALTRERKNPSRIARQIEIFSTWIFASLVPTLVPKHNSRFLVFRSTICWSWCMMIDKHLLYI